MTGYIDVTSGSGDNSSSLFAPYPSTDAAYQTVDSSTSGKNCSSDGSRGTTTPSTSSQLVCYGGSSTGEFDFPSKTSADSGYISSITLNAYVSASGSAPFSLKFKTADGTWHDGGDFTASSSSYTWYTTSAQSISTTAITQIGISWNGAFTSMNIAALYATIQYTLRATQVSFSSQPTSEASGATFSIVLSLLSAQNQTVTTDSSTVSLAISSGPGGGTLSGTHTAAASSGNATMGGLSLSANGTYVLVASDSADGLSGFDSSPIVVSSALVPWFIVQDSENR